MSSAGSRLGPHATNHRDRQSNPLPSYVNIAMAHSRNRVSSHARLPSWQPGATLGPASSVWQRGQFQFASVHSSEQSSNSMRYSLLGRFETSATPDAATHDS